MSRDRKVSRRMILRGAGMSSVALALQTSDAAGQASTSAPSISNLKSMRDQVKPITLKERQDRIEKARQLMAAHKIDAILLIGGTSQLYFTGMRWGNSERLLATVVPQSGKAFVVCPAFEEERAREQLNRGPLEDASVMTWQEDESPYRLVASGLQCIGKVRRNAWRRRTHSLGLQRGNFESCARRPAHLCHSDHGRLPDDQEPP